MSLRYHEISESRHRILNPFTEDKLMLLGEIARLEPGQRILDLCCGKGELLARWASRWGISGTGVDISEVFVPAAIARAAELGVSGQIEIVRADAGKYVPEPAGYDVGACIGATWIGDGVAGTIALLEPAVRPGGLVLIGEPYWIAPPPAYPSGEPHEEYATIDELDRIFDAAGYELVEMVLANPDSWDRYMAPQWWAMGDWLRANPDDPDSAQFAGRLANSRRDYLTVDRAYLGWGVFVIRRRPCP